MGAANIAQSRRRKVTSPKSKGAANSIGLPIEYSDFVLSARRVEARSIAVRVKDSPAGPLRTAVKVAFSDRESREIQRSFRTSQGPPVPASDGQMYITSEHAARLGQRLAQVLLPAPIFALLAESVSEVGKRAGRGVRIRLDLDDSLMDLPWEYLYRPDRAQSAGISGFLLLDPVFSMVRMAVNPKVTIEPATGVQRLNFIGTWWEGRVDGWHVWDEFDQLRAALKPVNQYIVPEFSVASDLNAFEDEIEADTVILHYAGHCDLDGDGCGYMVREMPRSGQLRLARKATMADLARRLKATDTRLVVLSACNGGHWAMVQPLIKAGVPAVVGINGGIASDSTIAFCTYLYECLALGLSLDEAVGRARLAVMEWGRKQGLFDWGLYMVYLQSERSVLCPRPATQDVKRRQIRARGAYQEAARRSIEHARELDGLNFGEIMSELTRRRILILGRFTQRRLEVLEAIKARLSKHENRYIPELFTFKKPDSRDLVESIVGYAALSRFVIADLSEPRSVQSELEAIAPRFQSVPIVPIINEGGREYATFDSIARRPNVVQPTLRYRGISDLEQKIDRTIVPAAEKKRKAILPRNT